MKRFVTTETYAGVITAYDESEDYKSAIHDENCACWVWQFAESKKQAVDQHIRKHDEWEADMNAGRPEKDTY